VKPFYNNVEAEIINGSKEEIATAKDILGYSPKGSGIQRYSKKVCGRDNIAG